MCLSIKFKSKSMSRKSSEIWNKHFCGITNYLHYIYKLSWLLTYCMTQKNNWLIVLSLLNKRLDLWELTLQQTIQFRIKLADDINKGHIIMSMVMILNDKGLKWRFYYRFLIYVHILLLTLKIWFVTIKSVYFVLYFH